VSDALAGHLLESDGSAVARLRDPVRNLESRVEALAEDGDVMPQSVLSAVDALREAVRALSAEIDLRNGVVAYVAGESVPD